MFLLNTQIIGKKIKFSSPINTLFREDTDIEICESIQRKSNIALRGYHIMLRWLRSMFPTLSLYGLRSTLQPSFAVGGQYKTWWESPHAFLKCPKKLHSYWYSFSQLPTVFNSRVSNYSAVASPTIFSLHAKLLPRIHID